MWEVFDFGFEVLDQKLLNMNDNMIFILLRNNKNKCQRCLLAHSIWFQAFDRKLAIKDDY